MLQLLLLLQADVTTYHRQSSIDSINPKNARSQVCTRYVYVRRCVPVCVCVAVCLCVCVWVCSTFSWSNNCLFCVNFEWAFKMIKFHFINILQLPEKDINFCSISVRSVANFKAVTTVHVQSGPEPRPSATPAGHNSCYLSLSSSSSSSSLAACANVSHARTFASRGLRVQQF